MTVLLAVGLGRVFLQPLVLLRHHCGEGHRHHHPLVVHHHCRERQWREDHRHHHPLVVLVLQLVGLEQAPQAEVVWPWVLWWQTTTAKMKKSFQTNPVFHLTEILLQRHCQCPVIRRHHHPLEVRHQCWKDHQAQILLAVYHQRHHHHRHPLAVYHQCRERQRREGHPLRHPLEDQQVPRLPFLRKSEIAEIRVART